MDPGPRLTNAEMAQLRDARGGCLVVVFAVAVLLFVWLFNPDISPL